MLKHALLILLTASLSHAQDTAKQRAIEAELTVPLPIEGVRGKSLERRMKELRIPALSLAVVENGRVVLTAAYGVADLEAGRKATPATLFQAASISKPVTAMAVMELVERGKLSLDAPVNSILRSWKLPENELTSKTPVTLRMLLSHSGGTTVHGFPGYPPDAPRPGVAEVLAGRPPANTAPVIVDLAPNTKFRYSGGGTTITQLALTDSTSLPFPTLMRQTVLEPLGMTASTYDQPLSWLRRRNAATAYRLGGTAVAGKGHVYPEMAAAGLWTTPADLAKVVIEMGNALAGRETKVLTAESARLMVTPRFPLEGSNSSIGLGFFLEPHGATTYFVHGGGNEGFRATLIGSADGSHGAVVMTNSDSGNRILGDVVNTIAREYKWPGYDLTPLALRMLTPREASAIAGRWKVKDVTVWIRRTQDAQGLEVLDLISGWQPLFAVADGWFARADKWQKFRLDDAERLPPRSKPTADELLAAGEIKDALKLYRESFGVDPKTVPEDALNDAGYQFLNAGQLTQAIAVLQLNTELYPRSANTWDSLAEVLVVAGQKERAIAATEEELRRIGQDRNASPALRQAAEQRLKMLRK